MTTAPVRGVQRWALISLVIGSLLLILTALEIGLRLFGSQGASYIQADDVLGYRYKPNAPYHVTANEGCPGWESEGQINSHGLRDYEYGYVKPEGTFRILALGDSFTAGVEHPLEYIWPKILEQRLNHRQDGLRYEVINGGRGAASTSYEYLYFTTEGYRYEPDLVFLLVIGNDILENSRSLKDIRGYDATYDPFYVIDDGALVLDDGFTRTPAYRLRKITMPLRNGSVLVSDSHRMIAQLGIGLNRLTVDASANTPGIRGDHLEVHEDSGKLPAEFAPALAVTRRLIVELNQAIEDAGASLVIFNGLPEAYWDVVDQPNALLTDIATTQDVLYLDLVPRLEGYRKRTGEYIYGCLENDGHGHWSRAGHLIAATVMHEFLVENGVLR